MTHSLVYCCSRRSTALGPAEDWSTSAGGRDEIGIALRRAEATASVGRAVAEGTPPSVVILQLIAVSGAMSMLTLTRAAVRWII